MNEHSVRKRKEGLTASSGHRIAQEFRRGRSGFRIESATVTSGKVRGSFLGQ
jgi:hypothetical protein